MIKIKNTYDITLISELLCEEFLADDFFAQDMEYIQSIKRLGILFRAFSEKQFIRRENSDE